MRRWSVPLLGGLVLLLLLTGCASRPRQESWPGLLPVGETLYAANWDHIDVLNAVTGELYWSYPVQSGRNSAYFYATPVYAADAGEHGLLLVAGFTDQKIHALALNADPRKPAEVAWIFAGAGGQYVGSGAVANGLFITGNGDGRVYALDLQDGAQVWSFATAGRVWATPLVVGDVVYIASLDHTLYAVNIHTGAELWRVATAGALASSPVLVGDALWIGDFARTLYQIDLEMRAVVWTYEAANWLWATPVVHEGILYFTDVGGYVYALNAETRELVWAEPARLDVTLRGRPVLVEEAGTLLVPALDDGVIYGVDIETGMAWKWYVSEIDPGRLPGDLVQSQGRLYAMPIEIDTRIRAFDLQNGKPIWVFPSNEKN